MPSLAQRDPTSFAYRKTKAFSHSEFRFKTTLAEYASRRLLPKLQARTAGDSTGNQYTGINVRLAHGAVFLEAILVNNTEWGGFGFDFARLTPIKGDLYNLAVRRMEDWSKADCGTVASAGSYFMGTAMSPRASDWVQIGRGKSFEECVELLVQEPAF